MEKIKEKIIAAFLFLCAILTIAVTVGMIAVLGFESIAFFRTVSWPAFFFSQEWTPFFAERKFGILPLFSGSLLVAVLALILAIPAVFSIAVYLSEYAKPALLVRFRSLLELLSSIPTVVYGFFSLFFVTPFLVKIIPGLQGMNALSPALIMGIMLIPYFTFLCEEALAEVPGSFRQASYALGCNKLETAFRIVVPAARPGLIFAILVSASRAMGETMIVAIAAGQATGIELNPLHPVETLSTYMIHISSGDLPLNSLGFKTIFAVGFMLFLFTFFLNSIAYYIKKRFTSRKTHHSFFTSV